MLQVPSEGTYEVAVTLVGVNGLRSESKSQEAATFEYAQMKMFDCAHTLMTKVMEYYYHKGPRTCWQESEEAGFGCSAGFHESREG